METYRQQLTETPTELLEQNLGYNPEPASLHGEVEEVLGGNKIYVHSDNTIQTYEVTDAKNMRDYIETYPQIFGLFYKGKYYIQE